MKRSRSTWLSTLWKNSVETTYLAKIHRARTSLLLDLSFHIIIAFFGGDRKRFKSVNFNHGKQYC